MACGRDWRNEVRGRGPLRSLYWADPPTPTGSCGLAPPEHMATNTGAPDSPRRFARAATGLCGTGCDAALHSSPWDVRINRAGRNDQAEYVAIFMRVST